MSATTHSKQQKIRRLIPEISDGTGEGFYTEAKAFKVAQFGSMFVKISEFGLFLKNSNNYRNNFLATLYDGYDGKITSKSIKGEEREPDIEDLPINVLAYSDFTLFKSDIKEMFKLLMQTGLARRFTLTFKQPTNLIYKNFTDEEEREFYNQAKKLGQELYGIFSQIGQNTCYKLLPEAKELHNTYKELLIDAYNEEDEPMLKAEIMSRDFKSIKLSCIFACLNHPNDLTIHETDLDQAINVVEYLSQDMKKFLSYRPKTADIYDKVYNFFKEHANEEFKKTELINTIVTK